MSSLVCTSHWYGSRAQDFSHPTENGNPLQYFCLENSMDRGARWATVHGFTESDMTEQPTLAILLQM